MFSLAQILVPTDFSARSADAARQAITLAGRFGSRITLLHAAAPGGRDRAGERMESFLAGEFERPPERVVVEGEPAEAIVRFAETNDCGLIMMPTRGDGPYRRFILGSVTAKVLHDANCPVWTGVHAEQLPRPAGVPRTIACAVDLNPDNGANLRWATALAACCGATLVAIHAIPFLEFHPQLHYYEADMRKALVSEARDRIAGMLAGSPAAGAEIHVEGGMVPRIVRGAAEDHHAGLLVIGRSPGGSLPGRLRTNSYAIIREAPCPVISV